LKNEEDTMLKIEDLYGQDIEEMNNYSLEKMLDIYKKMNEIISDFQEKTIFIVKVDSRELTFLDLEKVKNIEKHLKFTDRILIETTTFLDDTLNIRRFHRGF